MSIDLFRPGKHDPEGLHGAVREAYGETTGAPQIPADEPFTLASYHANSPPEAYIEYVAAGLPLPDMPLFFQSERYVNVPLEETYQTAFRGVPSIWRDVLEQFP